MTDLRAGVLAAVLGGLAGLIGWGFADFFAKKTIDRIGDVQTLVLAHLFGSGVCALALGMTYAAEQSALAGFSSLMAWLGLAFFGVLQAIIYLLLYRGFGRGQVALLNPLFASFSAIAALILIFFFGEAVTGSLAVALCLTFAGVLALNLDVGALRGARLRLVGMPGAVDVGAATILAAIWTVLWSRFLDPKSGIVSAALMYLLMTFVLGAYVAVRKVRFTMPGGDTWIFLALIGVTEAAAYLGVSWGYAHTTHASVVAVVSGASSFLTVFLARIFLRERTTRLQAAASVVIVLGVLLLNVQATVAQ